jgi:hypothetical protein
MLCHAPASRGLRMPPESGRWPTKDSPTHPGGGKTRLRQRSQLIRTST